MHHPEQRRPQNPERVEARLSIAQSGSDRHTIDNILRMANSRPYNAKHQGRNRVIAA
jgi:GGDEF domain-containing protein